MDSDLTLKGHNYTFERAFSGYIDDRDAHRIRATDDRGRDRLVLLFDDETRNLDEAARAASSLESHQSIFARYSDHGLEDTDTDDPWLVWVEDWIRGYRLKDILRSRTARFGFTEYRQLILDLAACLAALRAKGIVHGAISVESLILFEPASGDWNPTMRFMVANLSRSRFDKSEPPALDDDRSILEVLRSCFNVLVRRPDLPLGARQHLLAIKRFLITASGDVERGRQLDPQSLRAVATPPPVVEPNSAAASNKMANPFDYISTEHFSSDRLIYRVFAQSSPWVEEVTLPNPTLIEGPRGCGKSMILRWMSVKAQLSAPDPVEALDSLKVGAFYVSCTAEVQSRVNRFNDIALAKQHRGELIHYLNMLLMREVATTLAKMNEVGAAEWGLDEPAATALYTFLATEVLASPVPAAGVGLWDQLRDLALDELRRAQFALDINGEPPRRLTAGTFLHDLAGVLSGNIPFFVDHAVTYCLDDYSTHRIPPSVQRVLNEVVFSIRSPNHVFKISAENRGFHPYTLTGAKIEVQREMNVVNFGAAYLAQSPKNREQARRFASELLGARLEAAGWVGTPEGLLGADSISHAEFARQSREGKNPHYAGLKCIADLCSGDVATLLYVYRRIFDEAGTKPTDTKRISAKKQDDAIRHASRRMLQLVRSHHPHGIRMVELTEQFCLLSRHALMKGDLISEHGVPTPRAQTRIEVDGLAIPDLGVEDDDNTDVETKVLIELLRAAILIELEPGVARREPGTAGRAGQASTSASTRLMMRRIYLPAFELSLGKNLAWVWTQDDFLDFVRDPKTFCHRQELRVSRTARALAQSTLPGMEN